MKRTIFYSWQSDLATSINRNFIEDSLKKAIKSIKRDSSAMVEPVIDRDTAGIPGSPAITDTIFSKIALADVFIADVSIINNRSTKRRVPNPNVLIELGYAISTLGWSRILLVQNTAFGKPDILPFDIKGRRIVQYELALDQQNKSEEKGRLQGRLESALGAIFSESSESAIHAGLNIPLWWGTWSFSKNGSGRGGELFIHEIGTAGFLFHISSYNGGHTGGLSGFARLAGIDCAYARMICADSETVCELSFRRSIHDGIREINIEEAGNCYFFRGKSAYFSGTFVRRSERLFDAGILDEIDLARLYNITGQYFEKLSDSFHSLRDEDNIDDFSANVCGGFVRGQCSFIEGIVMRGEFGRLWAAFIDEDVVRYFTTESDYKQKLPKTIDKWRENFRDKPVIFNSPVSLIPQHFLI